VVGEKTGFVYLPPLTAPWIRPATRQVGAWVQTLSFYAGKNSDMNIPMLQLNPGGGQIEQSRLGTRRLLPYI